MTIGNNNETRQTKPRENQSTLGSADNNYVSFKDGMNTTTAMPTTITTTTGRMTDQKIDTTNIQNEEKEHQQQEYNNPNDNINIANSSLCYYHECGGISYLDYEKSNEDATKNIVNNGSDKETTGPETWLDMILLKNEKRRDMFVQGCYLSVAAVIGCLTRMIIAQLFGEACANPGTVGWLSAGSPLCVTKDGKTQQQGGIVFADLPSNILGSFLMGIFQDYTVLGLAVPMAVAWLPQTSSFQQSVILHTAFKTGFCGSLTTFSSWNSEMVVMIFGTDQSKTSQFVSAVLGYIIGMETSMGSFAFGCSCARRLHRVVSPELANEADAIRIRKEEGMSINHELPDFERKFLHRLTDTPTTVVAGSEYLPTSNEHHHMDTGITLLEQWRISTEAVRRVNHPLVGTLNEIEDHILVKRKNPKELLHTEKESIARDNNWAIDSLYQYITSKMKYEKHAVISSTYQGSSVVLPSNDTSRPFWSYVCGRNDTTGTTIISAPGTSDYFFFTTNKQQQQKSIFFQVPFASIMLAVVIAFLLFVVITVRSDNAVRVTDRTMAYAMLFGPFGALLRWHLSRYNNSSTAPNLHSSISYITGIDMTWFPYGTFAANLIGSMASIACIALEYRFQKTNQFVDTFWMIGTLRAFRVGFSGCLTTVSTFVSEVATFMRSKTDHAYPYIFITLTTCCVVCMIIYGFILQVI